MDNLISVIVPVYNVENYLEHCVESILKQTYRNIELILVDDGSTDTSGRLCDELKGIDDRIIVVHKSNGGLSDARNSGIDHASGKYITFIDSDDYISTNFLKNLYHALIANQSDISICRMIRTGTLNAIDTDDHKYRIKVLKKEDALCEMLYGNRFNTSACAKLYRAKLFKKIRYPLGKFSEDLFTTYKIIDQSTRVVYCDFTGYFYYYRMEGSIVVSNYLVKHLDVIDACEQIKQYFNINNKSYLFKPFSSQYISSLLDILIRQPTNEQLYKDGIWQKIRKYRFIVLKDPRAQKRLRAIALLTYLGPTASKKILNKYYERKWVG